MKKIYNTLNIVYFVLIIITVILIIYYVNNFYLIKKEKFTNNEKCNYVFNNKLVLETCKNTEGKLTECNSYVTNDKTIINTPEDINNIFINDSKTKKCDIIGNKTDTIIIKCCEGTKCQTNSYSNLINKTVIN